MDFNVRQRKVDMQTEIEMAPFDKIKISRKDSLPFLPELILKFSVFLPALYAFFKFHGL